MQSASLPLLTLSVPSQRFTCQGCTRCCRDMALHLTEADRRRIDAQGWRDKLDGLPYVRLGRSWILNQRPDRGCVFLDDSGRCRIHAEFGAAAKPLGCQLYPFVLWPAPEGWRVAYRFDCPTIAESKGALITQQVNDLRHLAAQLGPVGRTAGVVQLQPRRPASTMEVDAVVAGLDAWITDHVCDPAQAITGLCWLTETLAQVRTDKVRNERFVELIDILVGGAAGEVPELPAARAPTARQKKMLRQVVYAHCEALTVSDALQGRLSRLGRVLRQFSRSRRFGAGDGLTAAVGPLPEVAFSAVEQIEPAYSPDRCAKDGHHVAELVMRYLRAQILSRSCFGAAYYGWDVVTGLRALMLRLAVWGYLARLCAASGGRRCIDFPATVQAIGLIARSAGLSPALGRRTERLRLTYLQTDSGIERLLAAYPLVARSI